MLKKLFAIFTGSKPVTETKQVVEEVPPPPPTPEEEMKKLNFHFLETLVAYKAEYALRDAEVDTAYAFWRQLRHDAVWGKVTNAAEELRQRNQSAAITAAERSAQLLRQEVQKLEDKYRKAEKIRYLVEGTEIFRSNSKDFMKEDIPHCFRVIVKWQAKILLMLVCYEDPNNPRVDWLTESLKQFNNEELEAVTCFQSGTATK